MLRELHALETERILSAVERIMDYLRSGPTFDRMGLENLLNRPQTKEKYGFGTHTSNNDGENVDCSSGAIATMLPSSSVGTSFQIAVEKVPGPSPLPFTG